MAISVDNFSEGQGSTGTLTFSHTCSAGAVLYVGVMHGYDSTDGGLTSVTYNGTNLTLVTSYQAVTDSNFTGSIWKLDTPSSGANDVVITYSDAVPMLSGEAISLLGADTTGSNGASAVHALNGSANVSISKAVTTTQDNSVVVSLSMNNQTTGTQSATGTNQTLHQQQDNSLVARYGHVHTGISTQTTTTAGSYTSGFTTTGSNKNLGIVLVEVKAGAATGGATTPTPTLAFLGVG